MMHTPRSFLLVALAAVAGCSSGPSSSPETRGAEGRAQASLPGGLLGPGEGRLDLGRGSFLEDAAGIAGLHARRHEAELRLKAAEAEAKQRQQMGILDQERLALEKRVDELRVFERDYRAKLKSYIEGQLRELDTAAPVQVSGNQGFSSPVSASEQAPAPTFQGFGG